MQKTTRKILGTIILVSLLLPSDTMLQARTPTPADAVVGGHNSFATDLYRQLAQQDGNLFFSPLSISLALAMTYGGARGETADQMAQVLHFPADAKVLHQGDKALQEMLENTKGARLALANRLWPALAEELRPAFLNLMGSNYGAEPQALDFAGHPETARQTINAWVEKNTLGLIRDLLQPEDLDAMTRLVLTNAIVFQGQWQTRFDAQKTRPGPFRLPDGRQVMTDFMTTEADFRTYRDKGVQVLELPFADGEQRLLIALPEKIGGLAALEKTLSAATVDTWVAGLRVHKLGVALPKFNLEQRVDLATTLESMGMPRAFSGNADFSGIAPGGLFITKILHQARLQLHEDGAEAAAATAVAIKRVSESLLWRVDRPFLFLIRDHATGSILFAGRMVRPEG